MAKFLSFRDGGKTDEEGISKPFADIFTGEVKTGFATTQLGSPGMGVQVSTGSAFIDTGNGYPYHVWTDAAENVTIAAADGSNPRLDLVVAYVDLTEVDDTDPNNPDAFKIVAVAGTPAGSPAEPNSAAIQAAIGASNPYILLARVVVGAGVTTITNANITDRRTMVNANISNANGGVLGEVRTYLNAGSPHTWTKPAGLKFIEVEVVGGGGAGGGAASTTGTQRTAAGGGGGGGYSYKKIAAASLGGTETVTVGAGGTAGAAGNNNGNNGGNSSFGSHATANGGGGGQGAAAVGAGGFNGSNGGVPGTASGGDINIPGTPGAFVATYDARSMGGGLGGNSMLSTISSVNTAGSNFGGGGGGSSVGISSSATSGGAGAPGIVIVREYY